MSSSLITAFARFGAKPASSLKARSAISADGSLVLSCNTAQFKHTAPGVLRYEDQISLKKGSDAALLATHLASARDGDLAVRMIVVSPTDGRAVRNRIYARPDVIGKLVEFDGDRYVVDFRRVDPDPVKPAGGRKLARR